MHWRCFSLHNFTVVTEFIYASSQILVAETDRSPNLWCPRSTHLTWGPIVSAAHPGQWAQRRCRNGVHRTNFRQIEELHKPSWHICTFTHLPVLIVWRMVINGHHQLRVKVENQDMFHGACPNLRCTFRVVESAPTRHCRLVSGAVGLRTTARVRCGGQTSHLEGNFLRTWRDSPVMMEFVWWF